MDCVRTWNCTKCLDWMETKQQRQPRHTEHKMRMHVCVCVCRGENFNFEIGIRNLLMSSYKFEFRQNFDRTFYLWTEYTLHPVHTHIHTLNHICEPLSLSLPFAIAFSPLCNAIQRAQTEMCTPKMRNEKPMTMHTQRTTSSVTHA